MPADAPVIQMFFILTHYPLLLNKIRRLAPTGTNIISQGEIVAKSLIDYLGRHPEIDGKCSKNGLVEFYTTDSAVDFDRKSAVFFGKPVGSVHIEIN